jgi:RNA recognition motif-containing protein
MYVARSCYIERETKMNIYVGNISLEVTEEELRREFMVFGQVMFV